MDRTTGIGLIVFGLILGVTGAIMWLAVNVHTSGFDITTAGLIALWVGIVAFVTGVIFAAVGRRSRTTTRESAVDTPGHEERVQELDSWSS